MPRINKTLEQWFDWPNDELGGRILIRHLKEGQVVDIHAKCAATRQTFGTKDKTMEAETHHDLLLERELVAVAAVGAWENFFDDAGTPLECTEANKRLFAREDGFSAQIRDFRDALAKRVEEERTEQRKNLPALPSGSPEPAGKAAKGAGKPTPPQA